MILEDYAWKFAKKIRRIMSIIGQEEGFNVAIIWNWGVAKLRRKVLCALCKMLQNSFTKKMPKAKRNGNIIGCGLFLWITIVQNDTVEIKEIYFHTFEQKFRENDAFTIKITE